jgi:hypothetical protein
LYLRSLPYLGTLLDKEINSTLSTEYKLTYCNQNSSAEKRDQINNRFINNQFSLEANVSEQDIETLVINFDDNTEYDYLKGAKIEHFELEIGAKKFPRFSCASDKINLCVRKAISSNQHFSKILATLSKYASNSKHSTTLSAIFNENKCRLKTDNNTRWFSSFLMLETFLKAYQKNVFNEENPCPIDKNTIEIYLQILNPLHTFNLLTQRTYWTIGI